jgi:hypothetical protein
VGASRTWRAPVRGRFSFKPHELVKPKRGSGELSRHAIPMGKPVGEEILTKWSCYFCGKEGGYHHHGCPRSIDGLV